VNRSSDHEWTSRRHRRHRPRGDHLDHLRWFGDFCVCRGIFLVAARTADARIGFVGPAVMSFMLLRVRDVDVLEWGPMQRWEGYEEYVARTATYFPRPAKARPVDG
jgi:steroid 5-alpha reductase family enzyme